MDWRHLFAPLSTAVLVGGLLGASPSVAQQVAGSVEAGLQRLAQDLIASAPADRRPSMSVLPFPGADQSCPVLSVFVVDELTTTLITTVEPRPRIVERQQLETIIAQNQLDEFLTDPEQRQRLGGLSGIGAVILGTFTSIGDRLRINARMVAIDTGETIGAASVSVPRTREMEDLVRQGSGRGLNCLPDVRRSSSSGPRASGSLNTPVAAAAPSRRMDANCTQDRGLSACVVSITVDSNGRTGALVLRVTNSSANPVAIALIGPQPSLVGTDGAAPQFKEEQYAGTIRCRTLQARDVDNCLSNRNRYLPPNTYTSIASQGSTNAIFRFEGAISPEAVATFSAVFAVLSANAGGDAEPRRQERATPGMFNVNLSDLKISQMRR